MPITAIAGAIGGVATLASGAMQAGAAKDAANAQAEASDKSLAVQKDALQFQKDTYNQNRADSLPWLDAGKKALAQYQGELGMGGSDFKSGFRETPGYGYAVSEAEKGVTNNLSALGMKNSGAALKALTRVRMGLADQTYNSYLDRVAGVAGMGQSQANNNAQAGATAGSQQAQTAGNIGQALQDAGTAQASGYLGAGKAWGNALNGLSDTIGTGLGRYQESQTPRINLVLGNSL